MKRPVEFKLFESSHTLELYRQLLQRQIAESVRGSVMGFLWLVLNPLLNMGLYVVVFGVLFRGNFGRGEDESSIIYGIGVYAGLTIVNLINDTISKSTYFLHQNSNLIKRVAFPLNLLPLVLTSSVTFTLAVNCCLWLLFALAAGTAWFSGLLLLPVILLPVLLIALGLSAIVSALSVYLRDIQQLVTVATQIVFWSSGVFFSASNVMEHPVLWQVLKWNPVLLTIENTRNVVLWQEFPTWDQVLYLYTIGIITCCIGAIVYDRLKSGFSDFL